MASQKWNEELNPLPTEAKFYLKAFNQNHNLSTNGNPVEDLTEIMLDCYELLADITHSYTPTGCPQEKESVKKVRELFQLWPKSAVENIRDRVVHKDRTSTGPPPVLSSVLNDTNVIPVDETADENSSSSQEDVRDDVKTQSNTSNTAKPNISPPLPPSSEETNIEASNIPSSNIESDTVKPTEPERKSSAISSSASAVARSRKNSDYFNKLKEDEALAKKKQEEQEAKMKPEELKKLQEERRMAEEHNNSKTAHFSKLGAKYMPAKKKTPTGEIILERGGGGRGRGRGRGH